MVKKIKCRFRDRFLNQRKVFCRFQFGFCDKNLYSTKRYGKIGEKGEEKMKEIEFVPTNYPSDLTDSQWAEIEEYFPQGINSTHHKRSLINGVLYLVDNGCKWRALPHDFPPIPRYIVFIAVQG